MYSNKNAYNFLKNILILKLVAFSLKLIPYQVTFHKINSMLLPAQFLKLIYTQP